ncbi:MAG: MBL fold metallo-hydrolase [Gammaproteobacteria bacterium]|nr:MAG: MBL fold metallo-hydrolase [Gammaproteobacteria bacterium]
MKKIILSAAAVSFVALLAGYYNGSPGDPQHLISEVQAGQPGPTVSSEPYEWSPTSPYPVQSVYYPGTEELSPDEMRVIACGTGMPQPRLKQAAACFLVELGNGDKFIFDMGEGSFERIMALGIPLDQLNKVFLGHLHLDHAGDFPAFYFTGPVNNRLTPLRVWGPSGVKPEWGTKAWMKNLRKAWAWEEASRGSAVDPRGLKLEVNEFDWTAVNKVIYDENGVVVRSIPAIHADQSASFILEWNGLKFAFSSDTIPNKWWREHAVDLDLSIHECFIPPEFMMSKYGFTPSEAFFVGTQGHTAAQAFGKIMSITKPRHAVCYHFQNDHDTAPAVWEAIRETYDGPLDLAIDFMTWNVTKEGIRTRMAVPNEESFPAPIQRVKQPPNSLEAYQWTETSLSGVEPESAAVTNDLYKRFNKANGTDLQPPITSLPFRQE